LAAREANGGTAALSAVRVSPGSVRMSMIELLGGGVADRHDIDVEPEREPGERVVGSGVDVERADLEHHYLPRSLAGGNRRHHARLKTAAVLQVLDGEPLDATLVAVPEALFRRHLDGKAVAFLAALQGAFERGEDAAVTVEVGHRAGVGGILDHLAVAVRQPIPEGHDLAIFDNHDERRRLVEEWSR